MVKNLKQKKKKNLGCIDCLTETLYSNIHINASYLAINDEQDISEIFYDAVDQNEEDAGYIFGLKQMAYLNLILSSRAVF